MSRSTFSTDKRSASCTIGCRAVQRAPDPPRGEGHTQVGLVLVVVLAFLGCGGGDGVVGFEVASTAAIGDFELSRQKCHLIFRECHSRTSSFQFRFL